MMFLFERIWYLLEMFDEKKKIEGDIGSLAAAFRGALERRLLPS